MAIPDYQTIMLPALKAIDGDSARSVSEIIEVLAHEFELTESERRELLPSGKDVKFNNRTRWALFYLKKAELVEAPTRGMYHMTERGRSVLAEGLSELSSKHLKRFPEFSVSRLGKDDNSNNQDDRQESLIVKATPEELLESTVAELRASLADELLEKIKASSPEFFERLVVRLIVAMGYGGSLKDAGHAVGRSGDGGIDGVIKEDRLGLDVIYLQAKRWENTVGRPTVQAFAGSLEGVRARRGIIITTSSFSREAHEYVQNIEKKIILIDGRMLTELMIDFNVGVTKEEVFEIKRLDIDFFLDG